MTLTDPKGKRALFETPAVVVDDTVRDDVLITLDLREGRSALFSVGPHQTGTGVLAPQWVQDTDLAPGDPGEDRNDLTVDTGQGAQPLAAMSELPTALVVPGGVGVVTSHQESSPPETRS